MPEKITTGRAKLTDRQELFCIEYVLNKGNASEAARRAGYSENNDEQQGYENLRKPYIIARIHQLKEEAGVKTGASVEWAESLLVSTAERCSQREEIRDSEGNSTGIYKFDSRGVTQAVATLIKLKGWEDKEKDKPEQSPEERLAFLNEEIPRLQAIEEAEMIAKLTPLIREQVIAELKAAGSL